MVNMGAEWGGQGVDQQSPETLGGNPPQSPDHSIALYFTSTTSRLVLQDPRPFSD